MCAHVHGAWYCAPAMRCDRGIWRYTYTQAVLDNTPFVSLLGAVFALVLMDGIAALCLQRACVLVLGRAPCLPPAHAAEYSLPLATSPRSVQFHMPTELHSAHTCHTPWLSFVHSLHSACHACALCIACVKKKIPQTTKTKHTHTQGRERRAGGTHGTHTHTTYIMALTHSPYTHTTYIMALTHTPYTHTTYIMALTHTTYIHTTYIMHLCVCG